MTSACMHLKLTLDIFISICYVLPIYHSAVHRLLNDASLLSGMVYMIRGWTSGYNLPA